MSKQPKSFGANTYMGARLRDTEQRVMALEANMARLGEFMQFILGRIDQTNEALAAFEAKFATPTDSEPVSGEVVETPAEPEASS